MSFAVAPGLHEHDRRGVPYLDGATFEASVERFFARPDDLVFGNETAAQAGERFAAAVERALAQHPSGDVGVVAHGTVVSLFVARHAGVDPFALWRRLGLPSFVVFSLPDLRLLTTVENIEGLGSRRVSQRSTVP